MPTVTQKQIDDFADATGDRQWIHTDPVRAAAGPFGMMIAHEYLTLSLVPKRLDQIFALEDVTMQINDGADRLGFPSVVPVGSRIRRGVELRGVRPIALGHLIRVKMTIERDGGEKPVCVMDVLRVATA